MRPSLANLRGEIRPMVRLAAPLVLAEISRVLRGIVDTMMVGRLPNGTGDTRTAVLVHLISDWGIGVPVAWYFCFRLGWRAFGLWIGSSLAMILAGILLLIAWTRRLQRLLVLKASRGW